MWLPLRLAPLLFLLSLAMGLSPGLAWAVAPCSAVPTLVRDIDPRTTPESDLSAPVDVNGTLYFAANDVDQGVELWKSDGTLAGTMLVRDIRGGPAS